MWTLTVRCIIRRGVREQMQGEATRSLRLRSEWYGYKPKNTKGCWSHSKPGESKENSSLGPQGKHDSTNSGFILDTQTHNYEWRPLCCCEVLSLKNFVLVTPGNEAVDWVGPLYKKGTVWNSPGKTAVDSMIRERTWPLKLRAVVTFLFLYTVYLLELKATLFLMKTGEKRTHMHVCTHTNTPTTTTTHGTVTVNIWLMASGGSAYILTI